MPIQIKKLHKEFTRPKVEGLKVEDEDIFFYILQRGKASKYIPFYDCKCGHLVFTHKKYHGKCEILHCNCLIFLNNFEITGDLNEEAGCF